MAYLEPMTNEEYRVFSRRNNVEQGKPASKVDAFPKGFFGDEPETVAKVGDEEALIDYPGLFNEETDSIGGVYGFENLVEDGGLIEITDQMYPRLTIAGDKQTLRIGISPATLAIIEPTENEKNLGGQSFEGRMHDFLLLSRMNVGKMHKEDDQTYKVIFWMDRDGYEGGEVMVDFLAKMRWEYINEKKDQAMTVVIGLLHETNFW